MPIVCIGKPLPGMTLLLLVGRKALLAVGLRFVMKISANKLVGLFGLKPLSHKGLGAS